MKFFSFYLQKIPDVNFIVYAYINRIIFFFQSLFNIKKYKSTKTFKKRKLLIIIKITLIIQTDYVQSLSKYKSHFTNND